MPPSESTLPVPGAVLFDLDGTLVDTVGTRIEAWLETMESAGYPTTRERLAPLIGIDGRRLAREVVALTGDRLDDARAEQIDRDSGLIYARLNRTPRPLPGVADLVALLDRRGIPWAIATSSRRAQVAASVDALGLTVAPRVVDAGHVQRAKPEPDLLLHAAAQLGVEPERCWYVGDSTWDVIAAVAAGMVAIAVTAGSGVDARVLREAGATVVVDGLGDVAALLGEVGVIG